MKIYLAETGSRPYVIKEAMKLYLAGHNAKFEILKGNIGYKWAGDYNKIIKEHRPCILESFYYLRSKEKWVKEVKPFIKDFMLDSGAFTYLNGCGEKVDWDQYIEEYAKFIKELNIDLFLELDIDSIVGLKEVERLRKKLEKLTNKKSIPVFHRARGLDYWKKMVKEYDYVAIGGIVTKEIKGSEYDVFFHLLKIAKEQKCKVHGLGFTRIEGLKKYKFYSVDSTAWLYGNRGGFLYLFKNNTLTKIHPKGKRLKGRIAATHNFCEWLKFSKYAELNL